MPNKTNVIISGAGIAGMACALALAKNGYKITIYEKVSKLLEVGAGLQLAPNATRLLQDWGILESIQKLGIEPETITLRDGSKNHILSTLPVKKVSLTRWKSPYITIYRANLQKILYEAILKNPRIDIQLGKTIIDYQGSLDQGYKVTILEDQNTVSDHSNLLVISDGVWSNLRQVHSNEKSKFSGYSAWRATLPFDQAPENFIIENINPKINVYMQCNGHFITYPAKENGIYNIVAITAAENPDQNITISDSKSHLLNIFSNWHSTITNIINKADNWSYWPLFIMPSLRFRGVNNEIFVGDASHALTPFAAQGAAMAIEDAATLASVLKYTDNFKNAISIYEQERTIRLNKVIKRGNFNRFIYHASGPVALARNLFMKMRPQENFLTDLDWLYNFDARKF